MSTDRLAPEAAADPDTHRARVTTIEARLEAAYGAARKPRLDPLEELVLTILSQNTTDRNRDRAWESLHNRFPDWEAVRDAATEEVEEAIRVAGLAGQKAATIRRVLERLGERGPPSLDLLRELDDEDALDFLCSFKGVGRKTAACVLCFALGRPVMPVDTHVLRVSRRLGLVSERSSALRAHDRLNELVPAGSRFAFHVQLVRHGRGCCTARRPACGSCPVLDLCPQIGVEAA